MATSDTSDLEENGASFRRSGVESAGSGVSAQWSALWTRWNDRRATGCGDMIGAADEGKALKGVSRVAWEGVYGPRSRKREGRGSRKSDEPQSR